MADLLRQRGERMQWYRDELLHMAKELGHRLLPAFNTTSGLPYPKVFLIFTVEYYRSSYFCQAKCVGEMCVCVCLLISHTIKPVSLTFCPHCWLWAQGPLLVALKNPLYWLLCFILPFQIYIVTKRHFWWSAMLKNKAYIVSLRPHFGICHGWKIHIRW